MFVFYLILVLTPFDQSLSSLAYAEMRLILARMIWNFDMEKHAEETKEAFREMLGKTNGVNGHAS